MEQDSLPGEGRRPLYVEALKFAGLSGAGWLLDFVLLLVLVRFARIPVFTANLLSASTAGLFVFVVSRTVVFRSKQGGSTGKTLFYLCYTVCIILLSSAAMRLLVTLLQTGHSPWLARPVVPAAIAKIIVTPLNLGINFLVSRFVHNWQRPTVEAG